MLTEWKEALTDWLEAGIKSKVIETTLKDSKTSYLAMTMELTVTEMVLEEKAMVSTVTKTLL